MLWLRQNILKHFESIAARSTFPVIQLRFVLDEIEFREALFAELKLFASQDRQLGLQAQTGSLDIPLELTCSWLEETYCQFDSLVLNVFSDAEVAAIERFHAFVVETADSLPSSLGPVESWHVCESWLAIMKQAKLALSAFAV